MTYEASLGYIEGLQGRGWRLGLERMRAFVAAAGLEGVLGGAGSPIRYLHVAGTNGKGSVTAYLQAMLVAQGFRAGGYFSPYVVDPRERIQIGGEMISRGEFAAVATELRDVVEAFDLTGWGGVTEFEFKTAMGFLAWKRAGCEVVALEVGLGGRLDATNVVTPAACAIVSISLDHTAILGNTEGEIAREKAGILKAGAPGVVGPVGAEAMTAIEAVAAEVGAPLLRYGREFGGVAPRDGEEALVPGLVGPHQRENALVAFVAARAGGYLRDPAIAAEAIRGTRLVGRMQTISLGGREVLADGAHNTASGARLADHLNAVRKEPWTAIVGMLEGHDPGEFFSGRGLGRQGLGRRGLGRVLAVPVENPRSLAPGAVAAAARGAGVAAEACGSLGEALGRAGEGLVVVTGSFYLVGEAIRLSEGRRG